MTINFLFSFSFLLFAFSFSFPLSFPFISFLSLFLFLFFSFSFYPPFFCFSSLLIFPPPVALIPQTSAILGVCEVSPGRSNIHYEGNLLCKSEWVVWVCGFCFFVRRRQLHSKKISKSKINPIIITL